MQVRSEQTTKHIVIPAQAGIQWLFAWARKTRGPRLHGDDELANQCANQSPARILLALVLLGGLIACGFQLRGVQQLPFSSLFVSSPSASPVATSLTRILQNQSGLQLTTDAKSAQAAIEILNDARERHILALSGAGKVREFELRQRVSFRVVGAGGKELIPANEIVITRAFAFNDAQVLAKESEEALLYRDMQDDIVQQIMRRLAAVQL
jgi:LPS-assembly lipoprotein